MRLCRRHLGDGIAPALWSAASVGWAADLDGGLAGGLGSAAAGLAFGIGLSPIGLRGMFHSEA